VTETQRPRWTDKRVEQVVGNLLRAGVGLAATVVLIGGLLYLVRHGATSPHYGVFEGEPASLQSLDGVVRAALRGQSRGIIQLGLVLLILTPIARVAFSVFAFARTHDWVYASVTAIVLALLVYSLLL